MSLNDFKEINNSLTFVLKTHILFGITYHITFIIILHVTTYLECHFEEENKQHSSDLHTCFWSDSTYKKGVCGF